MRFELNLHACAVCLRAKQFWGGTLCYGFISLWLGKDRREWTVCFYKPTTDIAREADLGGDDLVEDSVRWIRCVHLLAEVVLCLYHLSYGILNGRIHRGFLVRNYEPEVRL